MQKASCGGIAPSLDREAGVGHPHVSVADPPLQPHSISNLSVLLTDVLSCSLSDLGEALPRQDDICHTSSTQNLGC